MSTDSTELTFVRCPSCRSLVPAVSTRCRMCGASLEASEAEEESGEPNQASGRVRQKTISAQRSDVSSALDSGSAEEEASADDRSFEAPVVEEVLEEDPVEEQDVKIDEEDSAELMEPEEPDFADPLSAYIEEVEEELDDSASDEKDEADITAQGVAKASVQDESDTTEEVAESVEASPVEDLPQPKEEAPPVERKAEPKVIVESGAKRNRGLSFAEPAIPKKPEEAKKTEQQQPSTKEEKKSVAEEINSSKPAEELPVHAAKEVEEPEEEVLDAEPEKEEAFDTELEQRPEPPKQAEPQKAAKPRVASSRAGRLFGWLVSYSDPDGAAIELREGKFFVSGNSLKDSDLVLDDESVSTPHAMVSIGLDEGLVIQDLMSERGIFVRRREMDTYHREEETVKVGHGDWIRFGDVEFLVSLIAHVGEK